MFQNQGGGKLQNMSLSFCFPSICSISIKMFLLAFRCVCFFNCGRKRHKIEKMCWFKALNCCTVKYQTTASRCLITQCQPRFHGIQFSLAEDICSTTRVNKKNQTLQIQAKLSFYTRSAFPFLYLTSSGITDAVCAENRLCHRLVRMPRCWGNEEASLPAQFSGH